MRLARLLIPLALAAGAAFLHASANAVQTLAFTFPVLCNDPIGFGTGGLLDLPSGTYVVTTVGACTTTGGAFGTTVGTPCDAPVTGTPLPCTSVNVNNVPGGVCNLSTGDVRTICNPAMSVVRAGCGYYSIQINGNCVNGQVATYWHGGGPMRVRFFDDGCCYGDNAGALLVTVVWTPL